MKPIITYEISDLLYYDHVNYLHKVKLFGD